MKNHIRLSLLALFISIGVFSQRFEITPVYGYQVGSRLNTYRGDLKILSSDQYGVTGSVRVKPKTYVEFSWTQQNTELKVDGFLPPFYQGKEDLVVNNYQFGAIYAFGDNEEVEPFAGLSVGWSDFDAKNQGATSTFSFAVSGGVKYFFNNNFGMRLQSQLLMPVNWGGIYYGNGGATVSAGSAILQLNFSGGLIFAIGDGETITFE